MNSQYSLEISNLTKIYGGKKVVNGLTFSVEKGEIFGIVGPDDAGKTSLMRMIAGILEPSAGDIRILGLDVRRNKSEVLHEIGYLAQIFSLYSDLTIRENLDFFGSVFSIPRKEYEGRIRDLLKFSNLERFSARLAGNLSGGMKKKLSVICALVHRPKILIMDEPTIGVDPVTRRELWRMFYSLRQEGITVVVSTSYMDEAELCGRIGYMNAGEFVLLDSPQNIKRNFAADVWQVDGKPREEVKKVLRSFGGGTSWTPFGLQFHLYDETRRLTEETVRGRFEGKNCERIGVKKIPVSVEDVFVKRLLDMES